MPTGSRKRARLHTSVPQTEPIVLDGIQEPELRYQSSSIEQAQQSTERRPRGGTACQACRTRKSKCDNQRPTCGGCSRHETECSYDVDVPSLCHAVGPELLQAVSNLTSLLQNTLPQIRGSLNGSIGPSQSTLTTARELQPNLTPGSESLYTSPNANSFEEGDNFSPARHEEFPRYLPGGICGLDSILEWKPFLSITNDVQKPLGLCGVELTQASRRKLPLFEPSTLSRLKSKYLTAVHIKNPILDLSIFDHLTQDIVENGLDWSYRTCLVCLVFALGAIVGEHPANALQSPSHQSNIAFTSEPELAQQFFDIAAKRMGQVLSMNDLAAVQCACLAGIWHMCNIQPIKAWKFFNMAGNTWCAASSLSPFSLNAEAITDDAEMQVIERNLYFTIFRSECELRMELQLPGSALEDVDLSTSFPQPPDIDSLDPSQQLDITIRGWYFILAELAIRHIYNRMLRYRSRIDSVADDRHVSKMINEADFFMAQLEEWYNFLPPVLKFQQPKGIDVDEEPDELRFVLRCRYFSCRDMILRPFVKLCVNNTLTAIRHSLLTTIAALASQCLESCMLKLTQIRVERHQGTWFMMRFQTTSAAILIAAAIAKVDPDLRGAGAMKLPEGWRERIQEMMQVVQPFWKDSEGRLSDMRRFLERGLKSVPET